MLPALLSSGQVKTHPSPHRENQHTVQTRLSYLPQWPVAATQGPAGTARMFNPSTSAPTTPSWCLICSAAIQCSDPPILILTRHREERWPPVPTALLMPRKVIVQLAVHRWPALPCHSHNPTIQRCSTCSSHLLLDSRKQSRSAKALKGATTSRCGSNNRE
jgi:hypothetical protein